MLSYVWTTITPSFALPLCSYVQDYDQKNPATWKGLDLKSMPMAAVYQHFKLDPQTIDFIGHSLALHRDDYYLAEPAEPTVLRIKLYHDSLVQYDGLNAPYIYPRYGLGELPQVRGLMRMMERWGLRACCSRD
jgi:Rab GDP dissociation inhibitor